MKYAIKVHNGHVRDWLKQSGKQKQFSTKELAEKWVAEHGDTSLVYEVVKANINHMTKQRRQPRIKRDDLFMKMERSYL